MNPSVVYAGKELNLRNDDSAAVSKIIHALSSEVRLKILALIDRRSLNVNEIARELNLPTSTAALHIQILEREGFVKGEFQPGARGTMKICTRRVDKVQLILAPTPVNTERLFIAEMPIGCYALTGGIEPTCGMAKWERSFHMDDDPQAFYHPLHYEADILWTRAGYVEYHFPALRLDPDKVQYIEFSFEACAETYAHDNTWPSDIYVEINGRRVGVWHCAGDFGGRRGVLNPDWWDETNTQFGMLKTWRVDRASTLLDGDPLSAVKLSDLDLAGDDHIRFRVGVLKTNDYAGGMNLFGRRFGDFAQGVVMRAGYYD